MTAGRQHDDPGSLFGYLERRDADGALAHVIALVDGGTPVERVVGLLAGAQRTVGERWQRNEWTVADEHAATAITDRLLGAVAATLTQPPVRPPVLVVCAEGEWHSLAGRMLADLLRAAQWDARFLGGSIPAAHLRRHLEQESPLALAVTCSIAMFLPGAQATIAAARAAGTPVVAGGRGFGAGDGRARALGASAWAPDAAAASALLDDWTRSAPPPTEPVDPDALAAYEALRDQRRRVVEHAEATLHERLPYLRTASSEQLLRTREDLEYLAAFVEAAVLTDDPSVLAEYLPWLAEVLESRRVPLAVLPPTVEAVHGALERHGHHDAASHLAAAAALHADRIGRVAG